MNRLKQLSVVAVLFSSACSGQGAGTQSGGSFEFDGGIVGLAVGAAALTYLLLQDYDTTDQFTGDIVSTRVFGGRDQFSPNAFAAYGMLAFPATATSETAGRFILFCEAFSSGLDAVEASGPLPALQAITIWPVIDRVEDATFGDTLDEGCSTAIKRYDAQRSRRVIAAANEAGHDLQGRGPFLVGWAPGSSFGDPTSKILTYDLSDVSDSTQALLHINQWSREFSGDPKTWDRIWNADRLAIAIQRTFTNYGRPVDRLLNGSE